MENDVIIGTDGDDDLRGTDGDDLIRGLGGDDTLRGRGGDDRLQGGRGNDTLLGGGGLDIADYSDVAAFVGVTLDLSRVDSRGFAVAELDTNNDGSVEERDRVRTRDVEGFRGHAGRDTFTGDARDNLVVVGTFGGNDTFIGGAGFDTIDYSETEALEGDRGIGLFLDDRGDFGGVRVGFTFSGAGGGGGIREFERIVGPEGGFNRIREQTAPNQDQRAIDFDFGTGRLVVAPASESGEAVATQLVNFVEVTGSAKDDVITGGFGNDVINGSLGDDTLRGGKGRDVLDYEGLFDAVVLRLDGTVTILDRDTGDALGVDDIGAIDVEAGTVDLFEFVGASGVDPRSGSDGSLNPAFDQIDASVGLPDSVRVEIDLEAGRLEAIFEEDTGGFSAGDSFGFTFDGFGSARGTANDDVLTGVSTGRISDDIEDFIEGGGGDDVILGRDGDDLLSGGGGDDRVDGGRGDDTLSGGSGNDRLDGRRGDDRLDGKRGDDDLRGGDGADRLDGRRGGDDLSGGDGDDRLFGQRGDDVIRGGQGADELGGGSGADTFRWTQGDIAADAGQAVDIVQDFEAEDFLLLAGREVSAREAFELARAEASLAGVEFGINIFGDQIVLRADGGDDGSEIEASEVFARLRIDADDFAIA